MVCALYYDVPSSLSSLDGTSELCCVTLPDSPNGFVRFFRSLCDRSGEDAYRDTAFSKDDAITKTAVGVGERVSTQMMSLGAQDSFVNFVSSTRHHDTVDSNQQMFK